MDTARPDAVLEISVTVDGHEYRRCAANGFRANLKETLGERATGLYAFDLNFDPRLSPFRQHVVSVNVAGYPNQTLPRHERVIPAATVSRSSRAPLLVTSTGRSGTTLLMSELLRHPQIVVADSYPYEIKLISYYASAFRALASEADRERSTHPDHMFSAENQYRIGHNPYNSTGLCGIVKDGARMAAFHEEVVPSAFARTFRELIDGYYDIIADDGGKADARFFAEKCDIAEAAREGARMLYSPVREVVLVRDPRDLLCSAKAFWKFSTEEALRTLETTLPRLTDISCTGGSDVAVVRYEDLIHDPVNARDRMYRFVGVDSIEPASPGKELFGIHGTSRDAAASVGRWAQDLTPSEIDRCDDLFADYLEHFGYERNRPAVGGRRRLHVVPNLQMTKRLAARMVEGPNGISMGLTLDVSAPTAEFAGCLIAGWSGMERNWVWSKADFSSVRLKWPSGATCCRLLLVGRPFTAEPSLTSQRLDIDVNGVPFGEVIISTSAAIEVHLEEPPSDATGECIVTVGLPDAARPCDLDAKKAENRLLGFALERIMLYSDNPPE